MSAATDEATRAALVDAASVETVGADSLRETPIASLEYGERRFIGPLVGMDYEERTNEAGIDIYVGDHRVGNEPLRITLKAPAEAEHQIALIRTLLKWARTETPEHRVGAKRP